MKTAVHTLIVLSLSKMSVAELLAFAKHVVASLTGNAHFPSPTPALAQVTADIAAVDAAETIVKTGVHGAAEARNAKLAALVNDLHGLEAYVQSVADATPAEAAAIIQSGGFTVKAAGAHQKAPLDAHMGPAGLVVLRALAAAKHAAYEWQVSTDGGKTWTTFAVTSVANTTATGLPAGVTHEFRVRATVGHTPGEWSQAVSLLVH